MSVHQKLIASVALTAFILMAGSIVCLASGQPTVMGDCGSQMQGAAMCPFMSNSVPTVLAASFGKQVALVLLLVLVVLALQSAASDGQRLQTVGLSRYRRQSIETPPASFLNTVLQSISSGILHSRVVGL